MHLDRWSLELSTMLRLPYFDIDSVWFADLTLHCWNTMLYLQFFEVSTWSRWTFLELVCYFLFDFVMDSWVFLCFAIFSCSSNSNFRISDKLQWHHLQKTCVIFPGKTLELRFPWFSVSSTIMIHIFLLLRLNEFCVGSLEKECEWILLLQLMHIILKRFSLKLSCK